MMLLLGHPRLGAQNANISLKNGLDVEKNMLPDGVGPAVRRSYPGAWKINIRPEIAL